MCIRDRNITVQTENKRIADEAAEVASAITTEALVETGVPAMAKGGEA